MEINFQIILCNNIMNMCKKTIKNTYDKLLNTVISMESLLSIHVFLYKNRVVNWFQLESARRGDS